MFTGLAAAGECRAQGLAAGLKPGPQRQPATSGINNLLPPASPAPKTTAQPARRKLTNEEIAERLKYSTCHIVLQKKTANGMLTGRGSGWVVDARRRLIITNHHVVDVNGPPDTLVCFFPVKKDGNWVADEDDYFKSVRPCKATIIASTKQHDLALIQVDHLPDGVVTLPVATSSPAAGSQVHCVGGKPNGSQIMWPYAFGRVRQFGIRTNAYGLKSRMVETQLATNQGNSGGPIVNDFCELVAVVEGGYKLEARVNDVSYHVDVLQVRKFLTESLPLVGPQTAEQFFLRGKGHFLNLRYTQAVADLSTAIRINNRYATAFTQRGWTFLQQGNLDSALGDFDDALKINATDPVTYSGRGRVFARKGRHQDAVKEYSNAIRFDANSAGYYQSRGNSYLSLNDAKSAYGDFLRAAQLDPKDAQHDGNCGVAARLLGMYEESLKHLVAANAKDKTNHRYVNQAGLTLLKMKNYKTAVEMFATANKMHIAQTQKGSPVYLYNLGFAAELMNAFELALNAYTAGITLNANDADLYYRRGLLLKKLGQHQKAAADLATAARLAPKKYGNATAQAVRGTGNGGAFQKFAGMWKFDGTKLANPVPVVAVAAFTADGQFQSAFAVRDQHGQITKTQESGTFQVAGDTITFNVNNTSVSRKFTLKDGVLWVKFQQWWIPFSRAK